MDFDETELPADFRQAYMDAIANDEELLDIIELHTDVTDAREVIGFELPVGWN